MLVKGVFLLGGLLLAAVDVSRAQAWTAGVDGKADARLADLFEKAVQTVVSGNWRVGGRSGAWAIRTFK